MSAQDIVLNTDSSTTRAVVVGISDYQNPDIPDLRFAHRDAELFAEYLVSNNGRQVSKENIALLTDSLASMKNMNVAFDQLISDSQQGDKAFLFFSCHADVETKTLSQRGFLLPWDSPSGVYRAGALPFTYLLDIIATLDETGVQVILIADIIKSGKLPSGIADGSQRAAAHLISQNVNEINILSCQPDEYSLEGEQWGSGQGVFSYYLVQGLLGAADKNKDQAITLLEIDRYLEDNVSIATEPHVQYPLILGDRSTVLSEVSIMPRE